MKNKNSKKNNKRLNENDMSVEFLPTRLDNREVQLGINIETRFHPELLKSDIVKIVLNKLTDNPQYYSNLILQGKVKHPEAIELYTDLFRQRFMEDMKEKAKSLKEVKSLIRSILKKKIINEISHIYGGNVSEKPEEVYVKPGVARRLEKYDWFQKGGWEQKDFPISDNPFGPGTGYRVTYVIQEPPAAPVSNSTKSDDFITASDKKNQPDIRTLNEKNTEKSNTKSKKIKRQKLEVKIKDIKQIIREELKRYLTETKKRATFKTIRNGSDKNFISYRK